MKYKYKITYIYNRVCPYKILAVCPLNAEYKYPDYIMFDD